MTVLDFTKKTTPRYRQADKTRIPLRKHRQDRSGGHT